MPPSTTNAKGNARIVPSKWPVTYSLTRQLGLVISRQGFANFCHTQHSVRAVPCGPIADCQIGNSFAPGGMGRLARELPSDAAIQVVELARQLRRRGLA